jgi:hypothetical protein
LIEIKVTGLLHSTGLFLTVVAYTAEFKMRLGNAYCGNDKSQPTKPINFGQHGKLLE